MGGVEHLHAPHQNLPISQARRTTTPQLISTPLDSFSNTSTQHQLTIQLTPFTEPKSKTTPPSITIQLTLSTPPPLHPQCSASLPLHNQTPYSTLSTPPLYLTYTHQYTARKPDLTTPIYPYPLSLREIPDMFRRVRFVPDYNPLIR